MLSARFSDQQRREPSCLRFEGCKVGGRRDPRTDAAQLRSGLVFEPDFHSISMVFHRFSWFFHGFNGLYTWVFDDFGPFSVFEGAVRAVFACVSRSSKAMFRDSRHWLKKKPSTCGTLSGFKDGLRTWKQSTVARVARFRATSDKRGTCGSLKGLWLIVFRRS